ncbi:hypothetical protein [uncultured Tateyamaria sp.]|uniref:hypothetical protein n=1 Tax=uncultured Tateyamaria sp. TaxID=455651 RepID=UPI002624F416|nr:hypothetical protein [uncultured Tateyamaria sp.]
MNSKTIEACNFDVSSLAGLEGLTIHNIRKAELGKLDGLADLPLKSLELRWLSSPDLTPVPLPETLDSLTVWHSSKLKSVTGIERAQNLKEVYLRENGSPIDITGLSALGDLEHLIIDGGYGDGQKINDLAPLEGLPLTELSLVNIKGDGLDFGAIARLSKVKKLNLSTLKVPPEELARIAKSKQWYMDQLMDLPQANASYAKPCKKCGDLPHELFLKGKKWHWCLTCQKPKVEEHLEGFRRLVAAVQ